MRKLFINLTMVLGIMSAQAQVGVQTITDAQNGRSYKFEENTASPKAPGATSGDALVVWNLSEEYATGSEIYISDEVDGARRIVNNWSLNDARITGYAHPKYPEYSKEREDFSWIKDQKADGTYWWTEVAEKQKVD